MSYTATTIYKMVMGISKNEYVLPIIQRELVWSTEQIEKLFDSIMSGYPIGSMLFWNYNYDTKCKYKFYEFLKQYDQYRNNHNIEFNTTGNKKIIAILDGQQRLTSLYLGLKGYLNLHVPRTRWDKAENFKKRFLFINLLYEQDKNYENSSCKYEFKFKTQEEVDKENLLGKNYWFEIGRVLDFETDKDYRELLGNFYEKTDQKLKDKIADIFQDLFFKLKKEDIINYFEEDTTSFDRVLQIFVRINSGGTSLEYTDLLMSIISNMWQDGRDKINNALDSINTEYQFNIPKDIFLRGCLFLTDLPLVFKVDNFEKNHLNEIQNNFSKILKYMKAACSIFKNFGYSKENLRSNLIILPLAYYLYSKQNINIEKSDKEKILNWIQLSILNGVFGGQTTQYLTKLRTIIKNKKQFPLSEIQIESNLMNKPMSIDKDILEDFINKARYGTQNSWTILTMLYPSLAYEDKIFHEDHIYPSSKLSKEQLDLGGNYVANLQLLESKKNIRKQDAMPEEWLVEFCPKVNKTIEEYKKENFIPNIELIMDNYNTYIQQRKENIKTAILESFNNV